MYILRNDSVASRDQLKKRIMYLLYIYNTRRANIFGMEEKNSYKNNNILLGNQFFLSFLIYFFFFLHVIFIIIIIFLLIPRNIFLT